MSKMEDLKTKLNEGTQKIKTEAKRVGNLAVEYINSHDEMIKPIMIGMAGIIGGLIAGFANVETREGASCSVEDDVTGLNFRTKHALNNSEILELGNRMIDGQTKGDALDDMGLLKKERKRR